MTFNQGGTYTGYAVPPGGDPGQGTEYGVWQREPGSQNYSVRDCELRLYRGRRF